MLYFRSQTPQCQVFECDSRLFSNNKGNLAKERACRSTVNEQSNLAHWKSLYGPSLLAGIVPVATSWYPNLPASDKSTRSAVRSASQYWKDTREQWRNAQSVASLGEGLPTGFHLMYEWMVSNRILINSWIERIRSDTASYFGITWVQLTSSRLFVLSVRAERPMWLISDYYAT